MWELFDDSFESHRTELMRENFKKYKHIIEIALRYVEAGNKLTEAINATDEVRNAANGEEKIKITNRLLRDLEARVVLENVTKGYESDQKEVDNLMLQALYENFRVAESNMRLIKPKEYGIFLANLATAYGVLG
jgi:GDP-D-mannose dehydratase